MEFFLNMLNLQLMLFLLIVMGILVRKLGIIDIQSRKGLSDLLIYVILPCNIIQSFWGEISITDEFFRNCMIALMLSLFIQIFSIYISKLLFRHYPAAKKNVMSYGMICSNSSFIGIPIAEALYGSLGVLYTSIFQIPIRFTMWTSGLALFTSVDKKEAFRKLVKHPCIISVFIGFFLMLTHISLPAFLGNTIAAVSKCTVPVSMIVIGAILADANVKTLFSKSVLYFTLLRLVVFPVFIFLILKPFPVDPLLASICVIMSGMPAGSTGSILAEKYGCDSMFASQLIFVSTFCSIFTIPLLGLLIK